MKSRPTTILLISALISAFMFEAPTLAAEQAISLAGDWHFALDKADVGVSEQWFQRRLSDRIKLPGTLQEQGYGDPVSPTTDWTATLYDKLWYLKPQYKKYTWPGNVKIPFFLQPDKRYVGVAWYQKEIDISSRWNGRRLVLGLERPHWETRLWLDGREIGVNNSLSVPHVYEFPYGLASGPHTLTIRVDNRMIVDVGLDAHSVTDHTQTNWNGIVGRMELTATSPVWIDDVRGFPNVARKSVLIRVTIGNVTGRGFAGTLSAGSQSIRVKCDEKGGTAEFEVPLGESRAVG